jgi:hypothetical protein
MGTENEIDQLFKRGLEEPDIAFNELDWERMEQKLDNKRKSKILPYGVFTIAGIAASLLVFLFWFFLGPSEPQKGRKLAESKHKPANLNQLPALRNESIKAVQPASTGLQSGAVISNQQDFPTSTSTSPVSTHLQLREFSPWAGISVQWEGRSAAAAGKSVPELGESLPAAEAVVSVPEGTVLSAKAAESKVDAVTDSAILAQKARALALSKDPFEKIQPAEITKSVKKKMDNDIVQRPNLILSAMAAPDISSGPSATSRSSKVSTNLGLLATYALGSKFSLTSGAIYAKKYYNYSSDPGAENIYTGQSGRDFEVKADCNVLDIPVNVNYKLLGKKKLSVSINTGLSSYFMLKEKYDYIVDRPGQPQQISTTEINNKNQHVFGIANVSLSFDHQISKAVSLGVQPFAKLPLTGIGNYDINLKSAGVSFSLNIGLFPTKKTGKLAANRYSSLY